MLVAVAVAGLISYAVWGQINDAERELYFRGIGVAAILDVLGTLGLYPLSKLVGNRRRGAPKKPSPARTISPRRKPARRRLSPSR